MWSARNLEDDVEYVTEFINSALCQKKTRQINECEAIFASATSPASASSLTSATSP
jgi:hypothetical protein